MSKNAIIIFNRLLTALMLVASLMACEQMRDNNNKTFNYQSDRYSRSPISEVQSRSF